MQIILLDKVVNLGALGDVVRVKDGYARNFLIPTGRARRATKNAIADFEARRAELEERIKRRCQWAVGVVEVDEIDRLNIFGATMLAMSLAVQSLCEQLDGEPHEVLVDGNLTPVGRRPEWRWPARAIVGGDAIEPCISAASIIAKEHRDRLMREYAQAHPHYGWERNAGYGTPEHLEALRRHGPSPLHRRSFAPVAQLVLL